MISSEINKTNCNIMQLEAQENHGSHDEQPGRKNLYAGHRYGTSRKDMFSRAILYCITLFGYSLGVGGIASQIQIVFIREAMTSDNRNSFFPSKNYLLKQNCQLAFGNLCPCADVTLLLLHNQICH